MTTTTARHAFAWTALFIVWHGYWALGGDFGFGDQEAGFPDAGPLFAVTVAAMFAAGLAVPYAVMRGVGPRRLLAWLLWAGAAVLAARGLSGLLDDALRFTGLAETGLTGLSDEAGARQRRPVRLHDLVDRRHRRVLPRRRAAVRARRAPRPRARRSRLPKLPAGWPAYAASALAIAYAIGVRGYQGLGGTIGLSGTFDDPSGFERASLQAGAFLLLVGIGALALVRPWGLRLPRWLVIVPALSGSVFAMAHALTAYVTKPLHLARRGRPRVPRLEDARRGRDDRLGPAVLRAVVPGAGPAGHRGRAPPPPPHRRLASGARRRLVAITAAGTLALTAVASAMVL